MALMVPPPKRSRISQVSTKGGLFEKAIGHQLSEAPLNKVVFTGELEADLPTIVQAHVEMDDGRTIRGP